MSESLKKKGIRSQGPFPFFNNKMEHPRIEKETRKKQERNKKETRKRKPWTLSFIEEAWICRTGAIFQRFSVKRRQARSERESESRARGGVKNTTTKTHHWILCKYYSKAYLIGLILNNKIREWINIRSTISRYLLPVEHQLTWKKENNNCSVKCCS